MVFRLAEKISYFFPFFVSFSVGSSYPAMGNPKSTAENVCDYFFDLLMYSGNHRSRLVLQMVKIIGWRPHRYWEILDPSTD